MVQLDTVHVAKNGIQSLLASMPIVSSSAAFKRILQSFGLNPLHQQVVMALMEWKEKILVNFVNVITNCVLKSGAGEFHCELVHQCSQDVLDAKKLFAVLVNPVQ